MSFGSLRIFLVPFSLIYEIVIILRKKLYESGIFKKYVSVKPIISVGNLSTGGTGKTPLTKYLAEYFLSKGVKVGILSRGYGRDINGFQIVYSNGIIGNIQNSGDEMIMLANCFNSKNQKNVLIAVDNNKVNGIKYLEKNDVDIIIMDDGFQSDYLKKDLDIVILDSDFLFNNSFLNKLMLPAGNLRVPSRFLKYADIIIQNNKSDSYQPAEKNYIVMSYEFKGLIDFYGNSVSIMNNKLVAISGIAKPFSFLKSLNKLGIFPEKVINLKDHFKYTSQYIKSILSLNYDKYITTEKDMVKIKDILPENAFNKFCYLNMGIKVSINEDILIKHLNKFV